MLKTVNIRFKTKKLLKTAAIGIYVVLALFLGFIFPFIAAGWVTLTVGNIMGHHLLALPLGIFTLFSIPFFVFATIHIVGEWKKYGYISSWELHELKETFGVILYLAGVMSLMILGVIAIGTLK